MNKLFSIISIITIFGCTTNPKTNDVKTTFADVAPIIYERCTPCHRPGSGAPFNLISYEDVKQHLNTSMLTIREGVMPPWPADTSYSRFKEEKVLTKEELALLDRWIKEGTLEGENIPNPPVLTTTVSLGKPDFSITMPLFKIKGNNKDHFMMIKVPYELEKDTFVKAIEIIPGNKKLVHHINGHLIQYEEGKKKDLQAGKFFVNTEQTDKLTAYKELDLPNDDGSYPLLTPTVTNYLPGVEVAVYPEGLGGYRVKKRGVLLLDNIHYGPSPIDTSDQTTFNFYFSPVPPKRPTGEFILGTSGISPIVPSLVIQPNTVSKFVTRYTVPSDISLLTVNPHMHLLGKSFKSYAVSGKDTIKIISIPKWDFRWQYFYTFKRLLKIPAGFEIIVEGIFDNTENNPLNPFHPPRVISEREGSMRTTDEMFQLICTFIPYKAGDENIVLEDDKP